MAEPFYLGCRHGEYGHFLWPLNGRRTLPDPGLTPWGRIDGKLTPTTHKGQGDAALHHKDGWTALAWHDYRTDSRPGSNGVVLIPDATLAFDAAVAEARRLFPDVVPDTLTDRSPAQQRETDRG